MLGIDVSLYLFDLANREFNRFSLLVGVMGIRHNVTRNIINKLHNYDPAK